MSNQHLSAFWDVVEAATGAAGRSWSDRVVRLVPPVPGTRVELDAQDDRLFVTQHVSGVAELLFHRLPNVSPFLHIMIAQTNDAIMVFSRNAAQPLIELKKLLVCASVCEVATMN